MEYQEADREDLRALNYWGDYIRGELLDLKGGDFRLLFKSMTYYFYVNKLLVDILTCISVPLKLLDMGGIAFR